MIKNRVKEVRKRRRLTLEKVSELSGLSTGQISRIERHERGWSMESLPKLARALGVPVGELLDASQAWQEAPVLGVIGSQIWVKLRVGNGRKNGPTVQVPAALGEVYALTVNGPALYPRYSDNDVIAVTHDSANPAECFGKECLVSVDSGYSALKFVQPGSIAGQFGLVSHNEPPIANRALLACRPVLYVGRG